MKKMICLLICLIAHTANALPSVDHTFTGLYLTGGVGASSAKFDTTQQVTSVDDIPFDLSIIDQNDLHARSASGLIGLSYMYQFRQPFVLGMEATAGYMNAQQTDTVELTETLHFPGPTTVNIDISTQVKAQLTNDFALLFKPGFVVHKHTLFYALVGPRWGNFETSTSTNFTFLEHDPFGGETLVSNDSAKESGYELGVTAGVGIQQMLTDQVHLSLEYAYTTYGEIKSLETSSSMIVDGTPIAGSALQDTNKIDVSTNTVMLAFSYQW